MSELTTISVRVDSEVMKMIEELSEVFSNPHLTKALTITDTVNTCIRKTYEIEGAEQKE